MWEQEVDSLTKNTEEFKRLGLAENDRLFLNILVLSESLTKLKPWIILQELIGQDGFEEKIKHLMAGYEKDTIVVIDENCV